MSFVLGGGRSPVAKLVCVCLIFTSVVVIIYDKFYPNLSYAIGSDISNKVAKIE